MFRQSVFEWSFYESATNLAQILNVLFSVGTKFSKKIFKVYLVSLLEKKLKNWFQNIFIQKVLTLVLSALSQTGFLTANIWFYNKSRVKSAKNLPHLMINRQPLQNK